MNTMIVVVISVWCFLGFITFIYTLVENIGIARFKPWAYRLGVVSRVVRNASHVPAALIHSSDGETQNLMYSILPDGKCLFRRKIRRLGFKVFGPGLKRRNTLFEMSGMIYHKDNQLVAIGSIPVGRVLFVLVLFIGMILFGVLRLVSGTNSSLITLLIGLVGLVYCVLRTYPNELRRFREIAHEISVHLGVLNKSD